ncbi:MAG: DUF2905 domain-containing protein [Chloroflexi bacterium]|nr:DUF2905 domain-containing protein [Chloroflexota bacterium]
MPFLDWIGRLLIIAGALTVFAGVAVLLIRRFPFIGHLPGDFVIHADTVTIFVPIVTFLLISLFLTLILNVVARIIP